MLTDYMVTCPNPRCHWSGSLLPQQNRDAWRSALPATEVILFQLPQVPVASGAPTSSATNSCATTKNWSAAAAERRPASKARRRRRAFPFRPLRFFAWSDCRCPSSRGSQNRGSANRG